MMVKITYIDQSGNSRAVDVEPGLSIMEGAVRNGIPGIDADCGGAMACATCHVYVDPKWVALIVPAREEEHDMLDFAQDVRENSRLSCQIVASEELDGLVVRTPATQR